MEKKPACWIVMRDYVANKDCAENSKTTYLRVLAMYRKWLQSKGYDYLRITRDKAEEFKMHVVSKSSGTYGSLIINVVRSFYNYYEDEHINNPMSVLYKHDCINVWRKVKVTGVRPARKGIVTADEVARMVTYWMNKDCSESKRNRNALVIQMLFTLALRRMELGNIKVSDVDVEKNRIHIRRKRQDVKVAIAVPEDVIHSVVDYVGSRGIESEWLFANSRGEKLTDRSLSTIVKEAFRSIGKDSREFSCHSLRHSAAVIAWQETHDILSVKTMLGHRDIQTTQIYLSSLEESIREDNSVSSLVSNSLQKAIKKLK